MSRYFRKSAYPVPVPKDDVQSEFSGFSFGNIIIYNIICNKNFRHNGVYPGSFSPVLIGVDIIILDLIVYDPTSPNCNNMYSSAEDLIVFTTECIVSDQVMFNNNGFGRVSSSCSML